MIPELSQIKTKEDESYFTIIPELTRFNYNDYACRWRSGGRLRHNIWNETEESPINQFDAEN